MRLIAALLLALVAPAAVEAKVLEVIPSSYVKVHVEFPDGGVPPGQLGKTLVYLDGPVLRWRGTWKHPDEIEPVADPTSPVPELLAPVRLVVPGIYKLYDADDRATHHGELKAETFTPESRIFRILLPITAMKRAYRYEVLFHAGLRTHINIVVDFDPPQGIVVRNGECVRQGVSMDLAVLYDKSRLFAAPPEPEKLDAKKDPKKKDTKPKEPEQKEIDPDTIDPTLVYLFCATESDEIQTAIYAPLDRTWRKFGLAAKKIYLDRGLFFAIPRPERGVVAPETVTEFELEKANGKYAMYELRYNPPYRPRLVSVNLMMGPSYHHYNESASSKDLDIDEIAWSGRLGIGVKALPEGFDVYGDIGGTISALDHGPSIALPKFEYWYMNARLGWVPRVVPDQPEWSLMTGWYWWRFYVDAEKYGLTDKLAGPQLFLQRKIAPVHGRAWWINWKWAFLGDQDYPSDLKNYEVAVGGGVEVAWVGKRRPLSLTLDFSRLHFMRNDTSMLLHNVVLGASFPIY